MKKLLDSFVDWFNRLFGWDYAGYDSIIGISLIIIGAIVFYFLLKLAMRPLVPLFNAEHAKINAHLPDIQKGVREAHRRSAAPVPSFQDSAGAELEPLPAGQSQNENIPFVHILPMEDFNHASEEASKLAGLFADGLADTLTNIPQVEVTRTRVDDDLETLCKGKGLRYTVNGKIEPRDDDLSVSLIVKDTAAGHCIMKNTQICAYDKMPALEKEFAAEVASAVLMHHRQLLKNTRDLINSQQQGGQSGSTYPSGRRPSPALPRKTGRPIA
ncbi:MAG: hypothetical protein EP347_08570 [Alphaproteobacteria bacterium]|nr:MAG: hypothetical protein EP347_08570 [Alphaproteobacteria bacterium]